MKKNKKKKRLRKFIVFLLFIALLAGILYLVSKVPIKNIYVRGNNILTDQEVIDTSNIANYPSFLLTTRHSIKKKLKNNDYIKDVSVSKWLFKVTINIKEYEPLFILSSNNKILLENNKEIENNKNITLPIFNDTDEINENFIKGYIKISKSVKEKISEIIYNPTEFDKDRYLLYMNDGNKVYITVTKIEYLNKYDKIVTKFEGKKGTLYLDSGNYFEINK